jgi:hypothetical protein
MGAMPRTLEIRPSSARRALRAALVLVQTGAAALTRITSADRVQRIV